MKKSIYLFIFFCLGVFGHVVACSCIFIDNFCEHLTYGNNGNIQDLWTIHHAKITSTSTAGVGIEIIKTFHGNDLQGKSAFITQGNGGDCRIFTDTFSVGEEYIFTANINENDFWMVTYCGVSYLKIENDMVLGQLTPNITQVPLSGFEDLMDCGDMTVTSTNEPTFDPQIIVAPTLANNEVNIKTTSPNYFELNLSVYDASGKLVYKQGIKDFNVNTEINVETNNWSNGIYFFCLNKEGKLETVKIIKSDF